MTLNARVGRYRTRLRKFYRDPVVFAIDLPNPLLGHLLRAGILLAMVIYDLFDLRTWAVRLEWALRHQRLDPVAGTSSVVDWRLRGPRGRSPRFWPRRLIVSCPNDAVVCALSAEGMFLAGTGVTPNGRAVLGLRPQRFLLRVYSLQGGRTQVQARPGGSLQVLVMERARGVDFDTAMRRAWPARPRAHSQIPLAQYRRWLERQVEREPAQTSSLRISVLMPVRDPPDVHLSNAIASVLDQDHPHVELCLADDGSTSPSVRAILANAAQDLRVQLVTLPRSKGVSTATNAALSLATGAVVAFVDHDDRLVPNALSTIARTFEDPQIEVAYSDEDNIDAVGRRSSPVFKTRFNGERLLAQNAINHLMCVRTRLLRDLGGLDSRYDGSQDHDLLLRLSEHVHEASFAHVPQILYHWRSFPGGQSYSQLQGRRTATARRRAIEAHLERTGRKARVEDVAGGVCRTFWPLPKPLPTVRVIVPTNDRPDLLGACITGLLRVTDYSGLKVVIVDNGRGDPNAVAQIKELGQRDAVEVIVRPGPFNHSSFNNEAAAPDGAEILCLLNDDILILEPGWLREMVSHAIRPGVGAVGAKLFYPDGRIQHAGVVVGLGRDRVAGHELRGAPPDTPGIQSRLMVTRQVDAVTAGCMVITREKFLSVGGFDAETFPVSFNDVDLCLRLEQAGLKSIWTPHARLIHIESASRGKVQTPQARARFQAEVDRMRARWADRLDAGADYHPALSRHDESFALAEVGQI